MPNTKWIKRLRWLQKLIRTHRIHHVKYGYGWLYLPLFSEIPYFCFAKFDNHGIKYIRNDRNYYHDCTVTGRY